IFVRELYSVSVLFQQFWEQGLVQTGTERTLKVIIANNDDPRVFAAAKRPSFQVDLLHGLFVRIPGKVHLGYPYHAVPVFRKQEIILLLLPVPLDVDGDLIIVSKFAGSERSQFEDNVYTKGNVVKGPHCTVDTLSFSAFIKDR